VRIDSHHHLWDLTARPQPWTAELPTLQRSFRLADLAPHLEAAGIGGTVVVQCLDRMDESAELLALAAAAPQILGVVGWVDLTGLDVPAQVESLRAGVGGQLLVAVRHQVQGEPDTRWLCRADVRRGLAELAETGLVFDLLVRADQLPATVETVRDIPYLQFVLEHAGKPQITEGATEPWASSIRELAALDNVAVKLSGLVTEADWQAWTVAELEPFADALLEAFGPDRTMFGSDWPVCTLAATYADVADTARQLTARWTGTASAQFWGGNAARIYGLAPLVGQ
jgi:L-fuconolactonase